MGQLAGERVLKAPLIVMYDAWECGGKVPEKKKHRILETLRSYFKDNYTVLIVPLKKYGIACRNND